MRSKAAATEETSRQTKICASLSAPRCDELAKKADRAFAAGADLVEFRIDLMRAPETKTVRRKLGSFAERAIFTVRPRKEGGGFGGRESDRLALIDEASDLRPAFIDVELRTLRSRSDLGNNGQRRIVSWHSLAGTPIKDRLRSLSEEAAHYGIPKIVPAAKRSDDNIRVLSLYAVPGPVPIAFCTGPAGLFSRVMAIERGSPISYASLDGEPTAPGQLSLGQALSIRRRLEPA